MAPKASLTIMDKFKHLLNNALANIPTIDECTSVGIKIQGKNLLAKNRDRVYNPTIKLVREIIDGTEVLYMYDVDTDYSEGMNEYGIGIVNTTLQGKEDEKEIKITTRHKKLSADGHKIRKALSKKDLDEIVKILDLYKRGLGGHTTIGSKKGYISIEKIRMGSPKIVHHKPNSVIVRTNHGLDYPDQGYQHGEDRDSSVSRAFYATKEARKAIKPEDLLAGMRKHHDIAGYLEPYRTNYKVWTSSQIMLNLTDLEMTFVIDENTKFLGIENRLPVGYRPKISLKIYKLNTEYKVSTVDEIEAIPHV
jgi:hypothetical protein